MKTPWSRPTVPAADVERMLERGGWVDSNLALHCSDCPTMFTAVGEQRCPRCGSRSAWTVAPLLRRTA